MSDIMNSDRLEIINAKMERARKLLITKQVSLVLVCISDDIFCRCGKGIGPLYDLVTEPRRLEQLKGGILADKVVGKAAALLALYAELSAVYADIISKPAYDLLLQNNVLVAANILVDHNLNRTQTGLCPMELLTADVTVPDEGYAIIGRQLQQWQQERISAALVRKTE